MLVTEFKDQKRSFQGRLKKEFVRKLEAYVTKVDYDDFDKLVASTEMGG